MAVFRSARCVVPIPAGVGEFAIERNLGITAIMRASVSIPDPLFQEAERFSKRLRIPRSQLYTRALEDYIKRQRTIGIKDALDDIYSVESSELDPVMTQLQAMALSREEW